MNLAILVSAIPPHIGAAPKYRGTTCSFLSVSDVRSIVSVVEMDRSLPAWMSLR
jgi:hypothetical protein